jgi:hypothetical protein
MAGGYGGLAACTRIRYSTDISRYQLSNNRRIRFVVTLHYTSSDTPSTRKQEAHPTERLRHEKHDTWVPEADLYSAICR